MPILPLLLTLAAGLSTVIGGLIALLGAPSPRFHARSLGLAAGVMLYLSFSDLLPLGLSLLPGPNAALTGTVCFLLGCCLPLVLEGAGKGPAHAPDMSRLGLISALSVLLHNLPEGVATFTVASADLSLGIPVAIAIALHNIPEGIAIAVPLRQAGHGRVRCLLAAALSGLSEPIGGMLGWLILRPFLSDTVFGVLYAGVGGIMTALSIAILLPAASEIGQPRTAGRWCLCGMAVIAGALTVL